MPNFLQPWHAGWWSGHDAQHVEDIGFREAEDQPIWRYALEHQAVIITKDEDFAGQAQRSPNGPVIVWLRIGNASNRALQVWFTPQLPQIIIWIEEGHRLNSSAVSTWPEERPLKGISR